MVTTRSSDVGPESRPVAIPADFGPASIARFQGFVTLESQLWWSGEELSLDTCNELDRMRLYEIVLTEGSEEDVRNYVSYNFLAESFDKLYLPNYVRQAWLSWFERHSYKLS